jgi:hypothetical protein
MIERRAFISLIGASGGLMSYGPDLTNRFREGASYVNQILRGAHPRDLPVQFATKFDLLINLKRRRLALHPKSSACGCRIDRLKQRRLARSSWA